MSELHTPEALTEKARNLLVTRALAATNLFKGKFYATEKNPQSAPTSDAAKRAEALYNNPESRQYGNTMFADLTEALTGESIRFVRNSSKKLVFDQCGVVVVPVNPEYGERADDGYTSATFVVAGSSGKGRDVEQLNKRLNDIRPLSINSYDWRVANQSEVEGIVDALIEKFGLKFIADMVGEFDTIDEILGEIG